MRRGPRRGGLRLAAILTAVGASGGALVAVAGAAHDMPKNKMMPVDRSDAGATHLAQSIFAGAKPGLIRSKFVTIPPGGEPVAISTRRIAGFPRKGRAFAILSTGCARAADNPNNRGNLGCKNGGVRVRGARDVTIWRIRLRIPKGSNCLSFRFKFLSEEYREFVGTEFNDGFIAELRGPNGAPQWRANGTRSPAISDPGNFARTRDGKRISINSTGVARVNRRAARGTTYDAATGTLRASTRVKPGKKLLYLSLFDQGDRQYDSAVFVDQLTVGRRANCRPGVAGAR